MIAIVMTINRTFPHFDANILLSAVRPLSAVRRTYRQLIVRTVLFYGGRSASDYIKTVMEMTLVLIGSRRYSKLHDDHFR